MSVIRVMIHSMRGLYQPANLTKYLKCILNRTLETLSSYIFGCTHV